MKVRRRQEDSEVRSITRKKGETKGETKKVKFFLYRSVRPNGGH